MIQKTYRETSTLLAVLRGEIIAYASRKKKENMQKLEALEAEIDQLVKTSSPTDTELVRLETVKAQRDELITECTHKNMFHAKTRWRHLGERGTKYFHGLKARNSPPNICKSMSLTHTVGRDVYSDQVADMIKECHAFFSDLYRTDELADPEQIEPFFANIPRLTAQESSSCEGELTETELKLALFALKNGTSPGPGGFTVEFFKCFWEELKGIMLQTLREIQSMGRTRSAFKQSVTILIPKRGKDRRYVKNLRPISLLDVSYKVYTKAIARRLERVIKRCVHEDQTGFIKGRFIGENVRLILDLKEYCTKRNKSALLLSCDFQKAYDSVDWGYLNHAVECFGFGPDMRNLISSVYNQTSHDNLPCASLQINGHLSTPYEISKGLRQGCPLSCFLFLLSIEPLLIRIRKSDEIAGVRIGDHEIRVAAYADDVTAVLNGSEESLEACVADFDAFAAISGLKLNKQKTRPFWIGQIRQPICPQLALLWDRSPLDLLGTGAAPPGGAGGANISFCPPEI